MLLLIVAILLMVCWQLWPDYYLEVVDEGGKVLLTLPLNIEEDFSLKYLHSVHHTPVKEIFQVSPARELILVATEFSSFGVGTPFLPEEGELTAINGSLLLKGPERSFPELQLRPLAFTEHQLLHRHAVYLLTDYIESGSLIILKVR